MKRICSFLLALFCAHAVALDRMYDMRYTTGPEILVPEEFTSTGGFHTQFEEDLTLPFAIKIGINELWELGAKLSVGTYDKLETIEGYLDLGAKFRFTSYSAIQADLFLGLNNDNGGAFILSYTRAHRYTRNVSILFEGRSGFFDAATGEDGWVKLAGGVHPQFQINDAIRFRIGALASGSLGNLRQDFMVDLIPHLSFGLRPGFTLQMETALGILQSDNNDRVRFGINLVTAL